MDHAVLIDEELKKPDGVSAVWLLDSLIDHAHALGASDLHFHPREDAIVVRVRIDGLLREAFFLPRRLHAEIISRIKILALLRTDVHHHPQDGRFHKMVSDEKINVRVSIVPTYYGENAILRLLADRGESFTLDNLGFSETDQARVADALGRESGMILVTGPTGSGKTTTLYSLLKAINQKDISIVTVEDPIEYSIHGLTQIQAGSHCGVSFATGLRSILRQDPDVIMVGEIRDEETARISVNAALTGHLLLSTLHTRSAAGTLVRLLDMNVPPYLLSSTLSLSVGQRLVRRICQKCKRLRKISVDERVAIEKSFVGLALPHGEMWVGSGCDDCRGSGYRGRLMIAEVLVVDQEIRQAILRSAGAAELTNIARANGMTTLLAHGFRKACEGLTTFDEVLRVTNE